MFALFRVVPLVLLAGLSACAGTAAGRPPNIVFILADDVGVETLGCYGGESYPTPALDKLASKGTRFDHCYSMPVCHPSRVALLTGWYPVAIGRPEWGTFPRRLEAGTFAASLRDAGYATAVAGKWQLAMLGEQPDHPQRLGFEESCLFGWHEGPRYYEPLIWQDGAVRQDVADRYGPDVYCEFLIDFMRRSREQPFLAFYSMTLSHEVSDDLQQPPPYASGKDRYDSFAEMMAALDARVGRVVAAVDELGISDQTVIVFTGDNGTPVRVITSLDEAGYHRTPVVSIRNGRSVPGGKASLTDGGTHVPLLVRWPGVTPAGRASEQLVDFSDFLATFCELAGVEAAEVGNGQSFAPVIRGASRSARSWAYSEGVRSGAWVRTARVKRYADGKTYDMVADPDELNPLADEHEDQAITAERRLLEQASVELGLKPNSITTRESE